MWYIGLSFIIGLICGYSIKKRAQIVPIQQLIDTLMQHKENMNNGEVNEQSTKLPTEG